jgi:hypothetical protein
MIVFKIINHKIVEVQVAEEAQDLAAGEVPVAADLAAGEVPVAVITEDLEKCTKRPAETAVRIVKYHSSQNKTNQFTAMIVFKIINQQEIKKSLYYNYKFY